MTKRFSLSLPLSLSLSLLLLVKYYNKIYDDVAAKKWTATKLLY